MQQQAHQWAHHRCLLQWSLHQSCQGQAAFCRTSTHGAAASAGLHSEAVSSATHTRQPRLHRTRPSHHCRSEPRLHRPTLCQCCNHEPSLHRPRFCQCCSSEPVLRAGLGRSEGSCPGQVDCEQSALAVCVFFFWGGGGGGGGWVGGGGGGGGIACYAITVLTH